MTAPPAVHATADWRARGPGTLVADQLAGLQAWHLTGVPVRHPDRHRALLARADEQLRTGSWALGSDRVRVVLALSDDAFRDEVADHLRAQGGSVVAAVADGPAAVAALVLDQPDAVLVQEALPGLPGTALVEEARLLAPATTVAAVTATADGTATLVGSGARAVFGHRLPPAQVAAGLLACVTGDSDRVLWL